jgi:pyruvate dehydrogenase E2 component (dihydrolipoamide acetyltransferase)
MATDTQVEVVMPQMGVSVSEGTITKWLKSEGEPIARDEALLEISTDKVDTEIPSPAEGVVAKILVQEGETVEVGTPLAVIGPEGAAVSAPEAPAPEPATEDAAEETAAVSSSEGDGPVADAVVEQAPVEQAPVEQAPVEQAPVEQVPVEQVPVEQAPVEQAPVEQPAAPVPTQSSGNGRTFVSPVVARIASEHGVDPNTVQGTGTGGRVTKKDILAFVEAGGQAAPTPTPQPAQPETAAEPEPAVAPAPAPAPAQAPPPEQPAAPAQPPPAAPALAPAAAAETQPGETFEPMTAMRKGIAEHMRRSLDTSAHVTSAIEVDMSRVVGIRAKLKKEYEEAYGVNPTYLSFVARATVATLREYPWINGEIRGDKIVTRNYVNLGFAVELADGKGLIVPVVKHTEGLNLLGMARAVAEIAQRAREKKLMPDDVQGGTFTITNPGGYGTFHGTPVISQPQAGILGTYAVVKRPWVVQDELGNDVIAIRPIMNVTLTYDHRLVDGALAGRFLRDLRAKLESWGESDY